MRGFLLPIAFVFLLQWINESAATDPSNFCEPDVTYDLYIRMSLGAPDGGTTRLIVSANDTVPGPELRIILGECVQVNIHNELAGEGVTIHYHGIAMKGTPWDDGTSFVSECPIQPGTSKSHVFKPDSPGTFWYHSHIADQMTDGVYGAFIVEDPAFYHPESDSVCFPPTSSNCIDFSMYEEQTIVISDWWTVDARTQSAGLESQAFVWIGDPQAILINGISNSDPEQTAVFNPTSGITYRVRIICASSLSFIRFGVENHRMTIIAADGMYIDPIESDYIDCANGQRYDALITADQEEKAYWLYAHTRYRTAVVTGSARVVYLNSDETVPTTDLQAIVDSALSSEGDDALIAAEDSIAFEKTLQGIIPIPSQEPDVDVTFVFSQQRMSQDGSISYSPYNSETQTFEELDGYDTAYLKWAINDVSYSQKDTPILLASYVGLYDNQGPPMPIVQEVETNSFVQVVLQNGLTQSLTRDQHPFHLHGHSFWVVGMGVGNYDPETSPSTFDLNTPVYRDTVAVYPGSWSVVRFIADNPGAWPFHCHIGAHIVMGMTRVFLVGHSDIPDPPPGTTICGRVSAKLEKDSFFTLNSGFYGDP
jgi:L-ascorbate oxidase